MWRFEGVEIIWRYWQIIHGASRMLHGHIDNLISAGYLEGWAYDDKSPTEPLVVSILNGDGLEIAFGLAHLYRADLAGAKCGIGWCAFSLRTKESISKLRQSSLRLIERNTAQPIFSVDTVNYFEGSDILLNSVKELAVFDPTSIKSVDELAGCQDLLDDFVKTRGVTAFVRTAYVYVLGRPVDAEGLATYGKLIRRGLVSPFTMIQTLATSTEFWSRPRFLSAPNTPGFPFVLR
jgi:hypothetical protein